MPRPIDLPAVVASLPHDHLDALRRALAGSDITDLAEGAGVPVEAVIPLLRLATAKLATALAQAPARLPPAGPTTPEPGGS